MPTMNFKTRWISAVLFLAGLLLFLFSHWSCQPCKTCDRYKDSSEFDSTNKEENIFTTKKVHIPSLDVKTAENDRVLEKTHVNLTHSDALGIPGTVFDCISWDERSKYFVHDFKLNEFSPIHVKLKSFASEGDAKRKETFQAIFDRRDWPGVNDTSYWGLKASGPGATMRNAQGAVAVLHSIITRLKSHLGKKRISLLDVPCGDLQWMSRFLDTRWDLDYTGIDIVPDLIAHHRRTFKRMKNAQFYELDVVSMPLNRSYDLILCRDMLQHLWLADATAALRTFSESGSRFLLATTFRDTTRNDEVDAKELGGRKSSYNLELAPFSLEPPICWSFDWSVEHLGLWRLPLRQKTESKQDT